MAEHNFTLILSGDVDAHIDDLFKARCDDATFSEIDGVPYAEFDREAPTRAAAVLDAVRAVESVAGVWVIRAEPDDWVTMTEIADRFGRTRESVRLLIAGERGAGGFPAQVSHASARIRLWRWADVAAWAGRPEPDAHVTAALNAALEFRAHAGALDPVTRDALDRLVARRQPFSDATTEAGSRSFPMEPGSVPGSDSRDVL